MLAHSIVPPKKPKRIVGVDLSVLQNEIVPEEKAQIEFEEMMDTVEQETAKLAEFQ